PSLPLMYPLSLHDALPICTAVPMWGYFCGTAVGGATATCGPLNPASVSTVAGVPSTWSPVVITVPTGQGLTINLTNSLSFLNGKDRKSTRLNSSHSQISYA